MEYSPAYLPVHVTTYVPSALSRIVAWGASNSGPSMLMSKTSPPLLRATPLPSTACTMNTIEKEIRRLCHGVLWGGGNNQNILRKHAQTPFELWEHDTIVPLAFRLSPQSISRSISALNTVKIYTGLPSNIFNSQIQHTMLKDTICLTYISNVLNAVSVCLQT
jgi:hypothetical protein